MVTDRDRQPDSSRSSPRPEPSSQARMRVARVIARARSGGQARRLAVRPWVWWQPLAAPGFAALVLLAAGLYSVPATRAALEDAGGTVGGVFSGWLGGDSAEAPGKRSTPEKRCPNISNISTIPTKRRNRG